MYPLNTNPMSSNPSSDGLAQPQNSMMPQNYAQPQQGLNTNMMTMPNAYAHGGRTKRGKLIMAHFNPKELDALDHLQGSREKCPRTGMRSYTHLEEVLKNPHLLASVHHHAREHHAHGGEAMHQNYHNEHLNNMASHGVHGDTELALIGPHMHHVLNRLAAPGTVTNHQDGRPQYWSLGGALSGLWNTIKGGAQAAAPYIGQAGKALLPAAMPAIQAAASRFGPVGEAAANGLGGLASQGFDKLSNMGSDTHRGISSSLGEGFNAAMKGRQEGLSPLQSAGRGLSQLGSRFSGAPGGALQGLGRSMSEGRGYGDMLKASASGAFQGAGGAQGLQNAAKGLMSQYRSGASPREMAGTAAQSGARSMYGSLPTHESMQNQNAYGELPYGNEYA